MFLFQELSYNEASVKSCIIVYKYLQINQRGEQYGAQHVL